MFVYYKAWLMAIWRLYTFCTLRFLPGQVVLLPGKGTSWLTRSSHLEFKGFLLDPSPITVCHWLCHCIVATLRCHFGPWIDSPNNWCWRGRWCWCWYRCRYQSYKCWLFVMRGCRVEMQKKVWTFVGRPFSGGYFSNKQINEEKDKPEASGYMTSKFNPLTSLWAWL